MNKYLKEFLHRGLIFGGFGPIVVGIVYMALQSSLENFSLSGTEVCLAIVSTYILAFLQAGASIFNSIEEWPLSKSLLCHVATIYIAYILCYLLNTWIPFRVEIILIFTLIFAAIYLVIWFTVYLIVKNTQKQLNNCLK